MKKSIKLFVRLFAFTTVLVGVSGCKTADTIKVYTRDTSSGTRDGFFTGIGFSEAKEDNTPLVEGYVEVASNGDMINAVKQDEYGIGYISLSSLETADVKGLFYESIEPSEENVLNGTYKLTRNFNYCLRSSYENETVKKICDAFVSYLSTIEGKATIKAHGGILTTSAADVSWSSLRNDYPITSQDNQNVVIKVGGSTSVKSIVSALLSEFSAQCGNFKYEYNPTGSSDAYKRTNGAEKDGANACDLAFASREFNDTENMDESIKGKMCIDAIVPVVNKANRLENVNAATLKAIFSGEITKWSELS